MYNINNLVQLHSKSQIWRKREYSLPSNTIFCKVQQWLCAKNEKKSECNSFYFEERTILYSWSVQHFTSQANHKYTMALPYFWQTIVWSCWHLVIRFGCPRQLVYGSFNTMIRINIKISKGDVPHNLKWMGMDIDWYRILLKLTELVLLKRCQMVTKWIWMDTTDKNIDIKLQNLSEI